MGSYISIHNDSPDPVMVLIGDDQAALKIAGYISGAIAAVAASVTGLGWAVGIASAGLVTITASAGLTAVAAASGATGTALTVVGTVRDHLVSQGYTLLQPGESYQSGKMTLSLWRQCHVVRATHAGTRVNLDDTYMRPIFSGPTDGSTNTHNVAYWVNKYPYERLNTFDIQLSDNLGDATIDPNRSDVLTAGREMLSSNNNRLTSQDGRFTFVQQSDSNLVLYQGGAALWANNLMNGGVYKTIMQGDGNLVSYTSDSRPLWASGTNGRPGAYLIMQNDGNAVIYQGSQAIWASNTSARSQPAANPTGGDVLASGQSMFASSNNRITSQDGRFSFIQQSDSNLVLYQSGTAIWANNTMNAGVDHTTMQADGNLVSYTADYHPVWASGTNGRQGAYLIMQNDGNAVIYQGSQAVWASNTGGR